MKLWIVVYVAQNIGMTVGPLPYGMDECLRRANDKLAEVQGEAVRSPAHAAAASVITIKCEWRETRPE